jgi:hypothetical protein
MTTMTIDRTLAGPLALTLALMVSPVAHAGAQSEERYRLVEVDGRALPVEVEKEWRCREYVTAATLRLGTDSLWSLQYTKREVCGAREETETEQEGGRYSVRADTLAFRDDDDDDDDDWDFGRDLDLDDLASATRRADGVLTARLRDGETTLVFRR